MDIGVHVHENTLRGKPLRAVGGHGVAVIEVPYLCWIKCDRLISAVIHAKRQFPIVTDSSNGSKVAVSDIQILVRRSK